MTADSIVLLAWPRWAQMWTLAIAVYVGCKWLTWQRLGAGTVPAWKQSAYLLAWPGMDAASFVDERRESSVCRCAVSEWLAATLKMLFGATVLFGLARLVPPQYEYVVGWVGMIGIVLILHFGAFHLLSCGWRRLGVEARPVMDKPLASTSLREFWGRRWNTAFRDLAHRFLFRPCASWFGPRWGILAAFMFSGAVHDLVISVPARGGYGGPTLFFAIQGAGMLIERSRFGRQVGLGSHWQGRWFAIVILVAPVILLFHRPFVVGIIVPFMRVLGAI